MTRYKITETIHHGNYRSVQSFESEHSVEHALRVLVSYSQLYGRDLPLKTAVGHLEAVGRAEFGWATYTLELLDS